MRVCREGIFGRLNSKVSVHQLILGRARRTLGVVESVELEHSCCL